MSPRGQTCLGSGPLIWRDQETPQATDEIRYAHDRNKHSMKELLQICLCWPNPRTEDGVERRHSQVPFKTTEGLLNGMQTYKFHLTKWTELKNMGWRNVWQSHVRTDPRSFFMFIFYRAMLLLPETKTLCGSNFQVFSPQLFLGWYFSPPIFSQVFFSSYFWASPKTPRRTA